MYTWNGTVAMLRGVCFSSVSGSKVAGIWPKNADKHHMNCADVTHSGNTIATGDDFGLIKLFDFPCTQKDASQLLYYTGFYVCNAGTFLSTSKKLFDAYNSSVKAV